MRECLRCGEGVHRPYTQDRLWICSTGQGDHRSCPEQLFGTTLGGQSFFSQYFTWRKLAMSMRLLLSDNVQLKDQVLNQKGVAQHEHDLARCHCSGMSAVRVSILTCIALS